MSDKAPSPSGAAFEVNGCSIVPVKLQICFLWETLVKKILLNVPYLVDILSKVHFPAFPVHTTFFLLFHHIFVQNSTNSGQESCLTTKDETFEYDGIPKMKNTNLKLEPGASGWSLQPLSVSCTSRVLPFILALLNGG